MSCAAVVCLACLGAAPPPDGDLLTVAESSGWMATATYDEVMELLRRIDGRSRIMRIRELGTSVEGRPIPLVILADPPVETPAEARRQGKTIVFALGNIHAGEVCGKEALLMLTRELALEADHPLLDNLVIVFAPIYNADGNERFSPDNRPGQIGPAAGMGERPNAQGLDLNRDHVKLESPETRALVRFLTEWDPHLTIDTHTTNGSRHRYTLTYAAPLNPSGPSEPIAFVRDTMLPAISRRLRERTGYETFFYGNFDENRSVWRTYSALPRFGGPYRGLRGQMSILSEAYAYASYEDRVLVTREFVREALRFATEQSAVIQATARRGRRSDDADPPPDDTVGIRHRVAAFSEPATILGWATDTAETPQDYTVVHLGRFEPTESVRRPWAYVLRPGLDNVIDKLRQHGVEVEPFQAAGHVEAYRVQSISHAEKPFQGHRLATLLVTAEVKHVEFAEGSHLVRTGQPLGRLAVYLLEPRSEDGLAAWNFLDGHVEPGGEYPVYRLRSHKDLDGVLP